MIEFLFKIILNVITDGAMSFTQNKTIQSSIRPQNLTTSTKPVGNKMLYIILTILALSLFYIVQTLSGMTMQGFIVCFVVGVFVFGLGALFFGGIITTLWNWGRGKMVGRKMPGWLLTIGCIVKNIIVIFIVFGGLAALSHFCNSTICDNSTCKGISNWGYVIAIIFGVLSLIITLIGCIKIDGFSLFNREKLIALANSLKGIFSGLR